MTVSCTEAAELGRKVAKQEWGKESERKDEDKIGREMEFLKLASNLKQEIRRRKNEREI